MQFTYVSSTHVLTITTGATFDLAKAQANWLQRGLIAWNLPAGAQNWTYRLYSAPEGGMTVDAEAILGGTSIPLTFDAAGLPPDVAAKWPHLAAYDALRLPDKQAKDKRFVSDLLRGQVAVVAFDELGRRGERDRAADPGRARRPVRRRHHPPARPVVRVRHPGALALGADREAGHAASSTRPATRHRPSTR